MVAQALKNLLSPEFDVVDVVEDGPALIDAAARLAPDVIVTDISMPRLDGLQALGLLRKENPQVRVVFLTMHQDAALVRKVLESGGLGYVSKCSPPSELSAAIRAALNGMIYLAEGLDGTVADLVLSDSASVNLHSLPTSNYDVVNAQKKT
jgi:DNA-binding NarL/FixJ family response regulator